MKILVIILLTLSLLACNHHTIKKTQNLSREYTLIQFSTSNKPYKAKEQVGGEQINSTTIEAKANETYLIEVKANNNNLNFTIDGESLNVQILDNNPFKKKVTVPIQTDIILSFSAHPDSSFYALKVTRL